MVEAPAEPPEARRLRYAAAELGGLLKGLAGTLTASRAPLRVRYGRGLVPRRSPVGFPLNSTGNGSVKLLLPDGRLWSYQHRDPHSSAAGEFFDVRTDYARFAHSRLSVGGLGFVYLGAELAGYTFGMATGGGDAAPGAVCAIYGGSTSLRCIDAENALAAIAAQVLGGDSAP